MAKKVKKGEEEDKYKTFHFPEFDVASFIAYELEQTAATMISMGLGLLVAIISWRMTVFGGTTGSMAVDLSLLALLIGLAGAVALPFLIKAARTKAQEYRNGDWAVLILLYLFLWLGLWSLFLNI
jgi:uncharacterized membrane protein